MPSVQPTPLPDFDLSWLEQSDKPQPPEPPVPEAPVSHDAPTMQIPVLPDQQPTIRFSVPDANADLSSQPTARIPELPLREDDQGPDLLDTGMPQTPPPAAKESFHLPAKTGLILGIVAGALVLALALGIFVWGIALKNGGTIYPNVYVAGVNVGGMDREEALDAVSDVISAAYTGSTLKVELPDRTLTFSPQETNIALSADEAVEKAMSFGRSGNPFSAVTTWFSSRSEPQILELQSIQDLDTDYIRTTIDEVAQEIETEPRETSVRYNASSETLEIEVGYPDRSLDTEGLYEVICNALMNRDFQAISWEYDETPCSPADLSPYAETYGTPAQDAWYDEKTRTIVEDVPGYGFDLDAVQRQIASAAPGSHLTVALSELDPQITTQVLEQDLFGSTLFETSSQYVVNANRTTNLTLACQAIDGTILNPGDVFSFNEIVGERTAEKGYQPATVYSGGQSLDELGGGVCQVASTLYYATLHVNLEQVHREPHQFVVTYVPYGMDATVYWGQIDYQFRNTLSNPIRILANTEGGSVNITIQGVQETTNTVKMEYVILETYPWQEVEEVDSSKEPGYRQVDVTPYTGYKVVTYKTILDADGNQLSREQEAISIYSKRDQKVIVGPEETVSPDPDFWPDDSDGGFDWDTWDPDLPNDQDPGSDTEDNEPIQSPWD